MQAMDTRTSPTVPALSAAAPPAPAAAPAAARGERQRLLAMFTIVGASVMDLLDSTIVNVAGPALRRDIGASASALQWIVAGYTLAFACMLITGARLGDVLGRKRMFLTGVAGFVTSSVLCSAAVNAQMLIATRVAQGAFAAVMIPQGLGLIRTIYPPQQRARALAVFGPALAISAAAGPVVGGALVDGNVLGLGWRAIFLLNGPVGLLALAGAARLLPSDAMRRAGAAAPRLDLAGLVLATGAALLLVYPLVQGREAGWPDWTFAMMAASVPTFCVFAVHQWARQRAGRDPLVETSIWRKRAFCFGTLFVLLFFGSMTGMFFILTQFMQLGEHFTPLHAGLSMLPWSVGGVISICVVQGVAGKAGPRRMIQAGVAVMAASLLGTAWTIHDFGITVSSWDMAPALFGAGFGVGLVFAPFFGTVLAAVEEHEVSSASGVVNAIQQLGSALGVAGLGTLFFDRITSHGAGAAAAPVFIITAAVLAVAWIVAFAMPKTARDAQQ
jgi:EmrB/QacA subfamily drug resistance transporter